MTQQVIEKKVRESINKEIPLVLTTANFLRNIEDQLIQFLQAILQDLNIYECEDMIIYAIRELAANANKANLKRLYFLEKNLDIDNSEHYQIGMASFKDEAFSDLNRYTEKMTDQGLYVKFNILVKNDYLTISIINNTSLSREEEKRINDKIKKAWDFESMTEAMSHILDGTEGAGLGIVSIIMMLRNIGICERDSLKIKKTPNETHSIMSIPYKQPGIGRQTPSMIEEL